MSVVDIVPISIQSYLADLGSVDRSNKNSFNFDGTCQFNNNIGYCADASSEDLKILFKKLGTVPVINEPETVEEFAKCIHFGVSIYYPPTEEDLFPMQRRNRHLRFRQFSVLYLAARRGNTFLQDILSYLGVENSHQLSVCDVVDILWFFHNFNLREKVEYGVTKYFVKGGKWDTNYPTKNFYSKYVDSSAGVVLWNVNQTITKDSSKIVIFSNINYLSNPTKILTLNGLCNRKPKMTTPSHSYSMEFKTDAFRRLTLLNLDFDNFYTEMHILGYFNWPGDEKTLTLFDKMSEFIECFKNNPCFRKITPPKLSNLDKNNTVSLYNLFSEYSDYTLMKSYEYYEGKSRGEFLLNLTRLVQEKNRFTLSYGLKPANADNYSIIHYTMKYYDAIPANVKVFDKVFRLQLVDSDYDPLISYGTSENYCSWFASELLDCFSRVDGTRNQYVMRVPDVTTPVRYGKLKFNSEFFDRKRMVKLYRFLSDMADADGIIQNKLLHAILVKLSSVLKKSDSYSESITTQFQNNFINFSPEEQHFIKTYACYLIMLPYWICYWDGPGHTIKYLSSKDIAKIEKDTDRIANRDANITREKLWRDEFFSRCPPSVASWLRNILVSYHKNGRNFVANPEIVMDNLKDPRLERILDKMFRGNFCILQCSDILFNTIFWICEVIEFDDMTFLNQYSQERFNADTGITLFRFKKSYHVERSIEYSPDDLLTEDVDSDEEIEPLLPIFIPTPEILPQPSTSTQVADTPTPLLPVVRRNFGLYHNALGRRR